MAESITLFDPIVIKFTTVINKEQLHEMIHDLESPFKIFCLDDCEDHDWHCIDLLQGGRLTLEVFEDMIRIFPKSHGTHPDFVKRICDTLEELYPNSTTVCDHQGNPLTTFRLESFSIKIIKEM